MNKTQFKKWCNAKNRLIVTENYLSNTATAIRRPSDLVPTQADPYGAGLLHQATRQEYDDAGHFESTLDELFARDRPHILTVTSFRYEDHTLFADKTRDCLIWIDKFYVDCFDLVTVYSTGDAKDPVQCGDALIMPVLVKLTDDERAILAKLT